MKTDEYRRNYELETHNWYFVGTRKIFSRKTEMQPKRQLFSLPGALTRVLVMFLNAEEKIFERIDLPFGINIIGVLEK